MCVAFGSFGKQSKHISLKPFHYPRVAKLCLQILLNTFEQPQIRQFYIQLIPLLDLKCLKVDVE